MKMVNNDLKIPKKGMNDRKGKTIQSLNRAKRKIKEIITLNIKDNHKFITLTYAKNMQNYEKSNRQLKYFMEKLGRPKYLAVKELQKRGAIHYHIILFNDSIEAETISKAWTYGFSKIDNLENVNPDRLGNYLGKYLADFQKGQTIKKNYKLYTTSKGLKKLERIEIQEQTFLYLMKKAMYVETDYDNRLVIHNKI